MYVDQRMSKLHIAEVYGVGHRLVGKWLRAEGITARTIPSSVRAESRRPKGPFEAVGRGAPRYASVWDVAQGVLV